MSDPGSDYRIVAKALWDLNGERLRFTSQVNADYGKWLLLTLSTTNLAAIYLLSQPSVPSSIRDDPWSYWPFVIGIVLSLLAGLATWINWALSAVIYTGWMNPDMLVDKAFWPKSPGKRMRFWLPGTFYLPIALGLLAAMCIPWGAYQAMSHMTSLPAQSIMKPSTANVVHPPNQPNH